MQMQATPTVYGKKLLIEILSARNGKMNERERERDEGQEKAVELSSLFLLIRKTRFKIYVLIY